MAKGTCTLPPDHTMGWTRSRLGVKICTFSFTNFHSSYLSGLGTFLQFPRGQPSHLEQEGFRSDELEGHFQLENCMTHSADYCLWQGKNEVGFAFCVYRPGTFGKIKLSRSHSETWGREGGVSLLLVKRNGGSPTKRPRHPGLCP